jgi:SAM-dependent methyltransferase
MNAEVKTHYDDLLGAIYSWTLGDFNARSKATAKLIGDAIGTNNKGKRALDLGCGTGVQTLALCSLGFEVTGVDFSEEILKEYRERAVAASANVSLLVADISDFDAGDDFDVALCFGDTVSHLQTWDAVRAMFRCVHQSLRAGGRFFLASRDHSRVYTGTERFLLVQADEARSMICVLDDEGSHVRVTDLVSEHKDGKSSLRTSSYLKLRVSPETLTKELQAAGFDVTQSALLPGGVHVFCGTKRTTV